MVLARSFSGLHRPETGPPQGQPRAARGRTELPAEPHGCPARDEPELVVEKLGYRVGGASILSEVSFEVAHGELLGIIGPNGAGKTTLFNLLTGLLTPTEGVIRLRGQDISRLSSSERARLGMGRSFQTSLLFRNLTALENARLAALAGQRARDRARAAGQERRAGTLWAQWWRRPSDSDRASEVARHSLQAVGLSAIASVAAGALSHGDKRKLELAVLLASDARVLLLDEPMAGVNAEDVDALSRLVRDLHAGGRTVLLVEHHMGVVLGLAERVAVLHHGRLLACGAPESIVNDSAVQDAYLGEPL